MARSRSSFELTDLFATATALLPDQDPTQRHFGGVPLVSFDQPAPQKTAPLPSEDLDTKPLPLSSPLSLRDLEPPPSTMSSGAALATALPPSGDATAFDIRIAYAPSSNVNIPPLPDLEAIVSPVLRCEKILSWIADSMHASDVFMADAAGLPIAGAMQDHHGKLPASGWVAKAVKALANAWMGAPSSVFELRLGEPPSFLLLGVHAQSGGYLVGLKRPTPLTQEEISAVRAACRYALQGPQRGIG